MCPGRGKAGTLAHHRTHSSPASYIGSPTRKGSKRAIARRSGDDRKPKAGKLAASPDTLIRNYANESTISDYLEPARKSIKSGGHCPRD